MLLHVLLISLLLQRCVALVDDMQARGIARTPEVYTAAMYACKEVTVNFNMIQ
jgi:hypothetical protein